MRTCLVLLGLIAGCNDGLSVDASSENFCDEVAEVACHNMYQCCSEAEIENELNVTEPRTELQCREDKRRLCEHSTQTTAYRDSLKAGRVTFDAAAFNTCLSAFLAPSDTCSIFVSELPTMDACMDDPWIGTVAIGGACFFPHDCVGSPETSTCAPDQKCVALATEGFPCTNGCATGFYCNASSICTSRLAEGAPCTGLPNQCQKDLFCDPRATPAPKCTAKQPGGAACTSDGGCISSDCVPGKCASTNNSCFTDTDCGGRCADDNSSCTVGMDYLCNTVAGHCDVVTTTPCSGFNADTTCVNAVAGTKCIFNVTCVPGDCVGDPVCTTPLFNVDYCDAGLAL